jgi:NAD+ diphosphatase
MKNKFKIVSDTSKKSKTSDLYFTFFNGSLLVNKEENTIRIPNLEEIKKLNIQYENEFFLGEIKTYACFGIEASLEFNLQENYELIPLYELGALIDEEIFLAAGRANQILNWDRTHRFCGKCGSKTENKKDELAKVCPSCNHVMYPVICPAIIVAVTKGDQILLAHNRGFKNNMYSLVAGFVEAGEDIKSTVKREVFEEIGIKIKNIRFHMSSPWSFPNSLMIGFFAEYESGEINVDGNEIVHADWFTKDNFPTIPQKFTLARKIIDEFIEMNK